MHMSSLMGRLASFPRPSTYMLLHVVAYSWSCFMCQTLLQDLEQLRVELRRAQQEKDEERRAKERATRQSAPWTLCWHSFWDMNFPFGHCHVPICLGFTSSSSAIFSGNILQKEAQMTFCCSHALAVKTQQWSWHLARCGEQAKLDYLAW